MLKKIDNINVCFEYLKGNNNKTIVFLHGFMGNLSSFSFFCKIFNNFGYNILNIDLTNHGFSNLPNNFTIYDYANVVNNLILKLKIENPILIGHSFGGRIIMILASMYNYKNKLIFVSSAGIKPKFSLKTKVKILQYKINKKLVILKLKDKKVLNKFGSEEYKTLSKNMQQVFINIVNEDLKYLLNNIANKTLILYGKRDKDTPPYMAKIMHRNIKNSKLLKLEGNHFAYIQDAQNFIKLVKDFIEKENLC